MIEASSTGSQALFFFPARRERFGESRGRRDIPCIEAALMIAPV
jgi:hypothetical protein